MSQPLSLFKGFGIELEYMVVDRASLSVAPGADVALRDAAGAVVSDVEDGEIAWSNELAAHVIELKTAGPAPSLDGLGDAFHASLLKIERRLSAAGQGLLPTAMHPWMTPALEAKLWAHENSEIYSLYDRIFGCQGHGWTNLQSMHVNLPFANDEEFGRLHAAVRFLLPILPAFAASSPIEEGRALGGFDRRLMHYQRNQARVPMIAGSVIPERAWTRKEYETQILSRIYADIAPHDPQSLLREDWLNSRGAIARFGRQTIEIRVMDIQESPSCDLALAKLACAATAALANESTAPQRAIRSFDEARLKRIFDVAVEKGSAGRIEDIEYVACWGLPLATGAPTFRDLLGHLLSRSDIRATPFSQITPEDSKRLETIVEHGSLAERIVAKTSAAPSRAQLHELYAQLRACLLENQIFR